MGNLDADSKLVGDLVISVNINPHPVFFRNNFDIHSNLLISFS